MRTLVTGGCGFIGSHLAEHLLKQGHSVVILDNLSSGRLQNIASFKEDPGLTFHKCDIVNIEEIEDHFRDIDWVFHLAALADIVPSIEKPGDYHMSNVMGTFNVLECARKMNVKRLIYAASSSCYGIPDQYPTNESSAIGPEYPYALTKYLGEAYAMHWNKIYGLGVSSLRFFNVYGPRSRTSGAYGAMFGIFLSQKLHNKPFTVVGDGSQTRDFIFVTDVVEACIRTAESNAAIGSVFNVGSGKTYSVNYIVELLGGKAEFIPKRPGEPDCTHADISKISKAIGWKTKISIEEGVAEMLRNINYWKEAPLWDKEGIKEATKTWFKYLAK